MDLCGVVGMNGLDWDGEEEAEWLWLLPGGTPVGPEAASQTRTELGAKNPEKTLSLVLFLVQLSRFGDHLSCPVMHPFPAFGERYRCHI